MKELQTWLNDTLEMSDHGGGCCGRRHLSELGYFGPRVEVVKFIQDLMKESWEAWDDELEEDVYRYDSEMGVEITLTEGQANQKPGVAMIGWPSTTIEVKEDDPYKDMTWDEVLTEVLKFKCVFKFRNPNTDNIVHVYFYSDNEV